MRLLHSFNDVTRVVPSVVTVGTFDGVHLGHQQLIRAVVDEARSRNLQSAIVTFFPHPRVVLGRAPAKYLTLPEEKAQLMADLGVDVLVVQPFTQETVQTPASQFVQWMVDKLRMQSLWIGPDFALGYKRQGNAAYLAEQGAQHGFALHVLPEVSVGVLSISSTGIREALSRGDIRAANLHLGRRFTVPAHYDGERGLCASELHWLPAPGVYPVVIDGRANSVTVTDSPCAFDLRDALDGDERDVSVAFV